MVADRYFPHRAAGFRSNPFRALTDADWSDVAVVPPAILDAFQEADSHLQIVGQLGAGKTTALLGLIRHADSDRARIAYEYLAEGQTELQLDANGCDVLLVDEAERLSVRAWRHLLGQVAERSPTTGAPALRLVLGTHTDLSARFSERGLRLTTVGLDEMSPELYRAMLARRLALAAVPGRPHATISADAVPFLMASFGHNRRAAITLLYEVFQVVRGPVTVDAALLGTVHARTGSRTH